MPAKSSSSKSNTKNEKADPTRRKLSWAQIAFGLFALLMIVTMILSLVGKGN
jgi:hypothetical protein